MAEIVLRRLDGYRVDRLRAYRVFIDGSKVGRIQPGEAAVFYVSPGPHQLQLKLDWGSSEKLSVDVSGEQQARFVCGPAIKENENSLKVGFKAFYYMVWAYKRYIDLKVDN